ncbi:MAG: hypothetical protein ACE5HX_12355 [bacterium]
MYERTILHYPAQASPGRDCDDEFILSLSKDVVGRVGESPALTRLENDEMHRGLCLLCCHAFSY